MPEISPSRIAELRQRKRLSQDAMGNELGVSGKYVGMLERGEKKLDEGSSLGLLFQVCEEAARKPFSKDPNRHDRRIPVVSMAHAGAAESYEELPKEWQMMIPTDCPDPHAFGLVLKGDSMKGVADDGDLVIVQPSVEPHSGCLAVVRLATDGILFREIFFRREKVLLVPQNVAYPRDEFDRAEVSWIYPTWGSWKQHWK